MFTYIYYVKYFVYIVFNQSSLLLFNIFIWNYRRTLFSLDGTQINNIAILGPYLYWINKEKQAIERVNKTNGAFVDESIVMSQTPHLVDIISIYIPTTEVIMQFIFCLVKF